MITKDKVKCCNIYRWLEDKHEPRFFGSASIEEITEKYELGDQTKEFMIRELSEFGRFWISDEILLKLRRSDNETRD